MQTEEIKETKHCIIIKEDNDHKIIIKESTTLLENGDEISTAEFDFDAKI